MAPAVTRLEQTANPAEPARWTAFGDVARRLVQQAERERQPVAWAAE